MNLALLLSEHILASCMAVSQHFFDSHLRSTGASLRSYSSLTYGVLSDSDAFKIRCERERPIPRQPCRKNVVGLLLGVRWRWRPCQLDHPFPVETNESH